ncbi:hypothetical protein GCM10027429_04420 [Marivirga atlantica]|jgi:hypothetical protein|uniref:DUF3052 family protein n=1 Tax=Marivirga atlantica TaxID=1548457 RepID=A0A937A810_9BACT|nr:DUF3052 family protein [Marivirga atlantica]MBL0764051.1 DUF3052 family protein [Marivirga atlantica]
MPAGYSKTPLDKKLGLKNGQFILLINQPDYYLSLFDEFPNVTEANLQSRDVDFIHLFTKNQIELKKYFAAAKKALAKNGILWISWPKKSAKIETDIDGSFVRNFGLEGSLVDTKVCAVDETWSGLKFMYRIKDR